MSTPDQSAGRAADTDVQLLAARARTLARPARAARGDGDAVQVVVFALGGETCALELRHLRQVLPVRELALLPGARPPLVALTGWRGELVGVFDLANVVGERSETTQRRNLLVIGERTPLALLVDEIIEMRPIRLSALSTGSSERVFVRGVTPEAVTLLDGVQLIRTLNQEAS